MSVDSAWQALLANEPTGTPLTVLGGTGHQGIPDEALASVHGGLRTIVDRCGKPLIGVCSLAIGTDQMFAEAVLDAGGQLHIVIPSREYEATFSRPEHLARYRVLLGRAELVETLDYPEPNEDAFLHAGHCVVDLADVLVAVWDGKEAQGLGGTADIVHYAEGLGKSVTVLWPEGVER